MSATQPGLPVVLGRTVRAEWARLWTVRSTWLFAAVVAVGVAAISLIVGIDSRGEAQTEPGETVWIGVRTLGMLALLLLLALASTSTTSDHATGGIVPTLQWTPRRGVLLAARAAVVTLTVTAVGLLVAVGAALLITAIAPVLGMPWDEGTDTLADLGYVYLCGSLLGVGVGLLLRSTAGAVVTALGLMLVLPLLLTILPFGWAHDIAVLLPGSSALRLVVGEGLPGLSVTDARITLAAWAAAALLAGGWRLLRSDANR